MRFLRNLNLNPKAPHDQRLLITKSNEVQFNTTRSLLLPSGPTSDRAATPTAGMMRLNTDTGQVELYQGSSWRSLRFKESVGITLQNLGNGDGISSLYGPLNPAPPAVSQSGATWTGANLMVYVENVFQIYNTNYLISQNPIIETTVSALANNGSTALTLSNVADIVVGATITTTAPTTTVSANVNTAAVTATYVSGGVLSTTMVVSGKTGIFVNGQQIVNTTGFRSNQYIQSGSAGTSFVLNSVANSNPSGTLTFASWGGDVNLIVDSIVGITAGMFVNGQGFSSGQTVVSTSGTNIVVLSAPPDSTPTGVVIFTSSASSAVFAASTTVTNVNSYTGVINLSQATTGNIIAGRAITLSLPTGYYIRFTGSAPATKPITVISGFDQ
jgi:hypothetical protein